jgi:hypothetical protein
MPWDTVELYVGVDLDWIENGDPVDGHCMTTGGSTLTANSLLGSSEGVRTSALEAGCECGTK